jgi:hypothetical protein
MKNLKRYRWAGHLACMRKKENIYMVLFEKSK